MVQKQMFWYSAIWSANFLYNSTLFGDATGWKKEVTTCSLFFGFILLLLGCFSLTHPISIQLQIQYLNCQIMRYNNFIMRHAEDIQPLCQIPGLPGTLFVSNIEAAQNYSTLQRLNIKAVITVANGAFLSHSQQQLPNYMYIPADDTSSFPLREYFQKTYQFIHKNLKRTNVLVHCIAGVSRSVTIVMAYIMRANRTPFIEVYDQIKALRNIIYPNHGFVEQLKDYENQLGISRRNSIDHSRSYSYEDIDDVDYHSPSKNQVIKHAIEHIYTTNSIIENKIEELRQRILATERKSLKDRKIGRYSPFKDNSANKTTSRNNTFKYSTAASNRKYTSTSFRT